MLKDFFLQLAADKRRTQAKQLIPTSIKAFFQYLIWQFGKEHRIMIKIIAAVAAIILSAIYESIGAIKSVPKTKGTNNFNIRSAMNCFLDRLEMENRALMPARTKSSGINQGLIGTIKVLSSLLSLTQI